MDVFKLHGGPSKLAQALGVPADTARQWKARGRIPARHWPAIARLGRVSLDAVAQYGTKSGVTFCHFAQARRRRGRPSCPIALDVEFQTAQRGDLRLALSPRQFALADLLVGARGPAYSDWLAERLEEKGWRGLDKALHELRPKFRTLRVEIAGQRASCGERSAYWLVPQRRARKGGA